MLPLLLTGLIPLAAGAAAILSVPHRAVPGRTLLLHNIYNSSRRPGSLSEISKTFFDHLCNTLHRRGYRFCSLQEFDPADPALIALTFDDGLSGVCEHALPVLEKYGFSATLCIITASLENKSYSDVYKARKTAAPQDIRRWAAAGMEVASHTHTHRDLTQLSGRDVRREMEHSRRLLQDHFSCSAETISFPLGLWNRKHLTAAADAGYRRAAVYNGHGKIPAQPPVHVYPVKGAYPFDSAEDIMTRILTPAKACNGNARGLIIPHFAKGTSVAVFDRTYSPLRRLGFQGTETDRPGGKEQSH
ncbi:MAG: polysaccharide deacetylase family protein [Fibrobacterota bacterium]